MRVRSTVGTPRALSSNRIICPSIADSLESFEETTTAASSGDARATASSVTAQSDFRIFGNLGLGAAWCEPHVVDCRPARQARYDGDNR